MEVSLFYSISSLFIGILVWLFIADIKNKKKYLKQENKRINIEQVLQITRKELAILLKIYQQTEQQLHNSELELRDLYGRLAATEERILYLSKFINNYEQVNKELCAQLEINNRQEVYLREVTIRLEETRQAAEEKQRLLIDSEQRLSSQFENLANSILEQSGRKVYNNNRQSLDGLLLPLLEKLDMFSRQVQDSFGQEARERHTLAYEIRNLQKLNVKITQEAVNLTRALKGDHKLQGNWGEMVLSRILEASGLREGHEFKTQVSMQEGNGKRMQPDVVIRLPQSKDIVIDSKMSLVAYERYFNSENETDRKSALIEHINSLRTHMRVLGKKDYQQLLGLRSLDYVLMFVPIEPAFMIAINKQPDLINEALGHNVMLVSPSTLIVVLRTINNLWSYENQSSNAQHIADLAARLYDKLRLFIDDMNTIGQCLDKAQDSYQQAINKLFQGRGNIISQAERFRALGVKIKRPIASLVVAPVKID